MTGGDGGRGDGGHGESVVLSRPDQIIGHRLFNMEPLPYLDPRRGELLISSNFTTEFYVRGIYKRSAGDPGLCDTFWRPVNELVEYAKRDADAWERVSHMVNTYVHDMTQSLNRRLDDENPRSEALLCLQACACSMRWEVAPGLYFWCQSPLSYALRGVIILILQCARMRTMLMPYYSCCHAMLHTT